MADSPQDADRPVLRIRQVRSLIGAKANQRATVRSLGLRRVDDTVTQPDGPAVRGMVAKIAHLVEVGYATPERPGERGGAAPAPLGEPEDAGTVTLEPGQEPKGAGNPAAGPSVADDDVVARAEAEAEALAVPGTAASTSTIPQHAAGLGTSSPPDTPPPLTDPSDDVPDTGVDSASDLPRAVTDPPAAADADETGLEARRGGPADRGEPVSDEALADPRGDLESGGDDTEDQR